MSRLAGNAAAVLAAIGLLAVVAFVGDPFGLRARRLEHARAAAAAAEREAAARRLEARAEADTVRRVERAANRAATAAQLTAELSLNAKDAPDANAPLDPNRLARLRANDERLCRLAALNGCPAASDHAGDGP